MVYFYVYFLTSKALIIFAINEKTMFGTVLLLFLHNYLVLMENIPNSSILFFTLHKHILLPIVFSMRRVVVVVTGYTGTNISPEKICTSNRAFCRDQQTWRIFCTEYFVSIFFNLSFADFC